MFASWEVVASTLLILASLTVLSLAVHQCIRQNRTSLRRSEQMRADAARTVWRGRVTIVASQMRLRGSKVSYEAVTTLEKMSSLGEHLIDWSTADFSQLDAFIQAVLESMGRGGFSDEGLDLMAEEALAGADLSMFGAYLGRASDMVAAVHAMRAGLSLEYVTEL